MNGLKRQIISHTEPQVSTFSKAKKAVVGTAFAVSSLLGNGATAFAQETTVKVWDKQIKPSHMAYVHPEDDNGKITVKTGIYATAPEKINVVTAGTKVRDISFPRAEYEKIIAIRERANSAYYNFANNETEVGLKELYDVYLAWREIDMTNAAYNQNGLAEKIRTILVHHGYTRLPPV